MTVNDAKKIVAPKNSALSAVNLATSTATKAVQPAPLPKAPVKTVAQPAQVQPVKTLSATDKLNEIGPLNEQEKAYVKSAKEKGMNMEKVVDLVYQGRKSAEPAQKPDLLQVAKDTVGAAGDSVTGLPQLAGNLIGEGVGYVAKKAGANPQKVENTVQSRKDYLAKNKPGTDIGSNTEGNLYKGVKMGADLIQSVIPTAEAGRLAKGASKIPAIGKLGQKVIQYGAQGAADTVKYAAISEGRLPTKGELAFGAGIGAVGGPALEFLGNKIGQAKPAIKDIVKKVISKEPTFDDLAAKMPGGMKGKLAASSYEEGPAMDLLSRGKNELTSFMEGKVDDITKRAFKDGNISPQEFEKAKSVVKKAVTDINAPGGFDTLAEDIANATTKYVSAPKQKIGQQIGEIKKAVQEKGLDLAVDNKPAIEELQRIMASDYNAAMIGDEIRPAMGGVHKFIGDSETVLTQLMDDLKNVRSANDITMVFDKANTLYDDLLKKQVKGKSDPRLLRQIGKVREKLEQQLDAIMGPEYKALRLKYKDLTNLEDRFKNLFQRSKPGFTDEQYTTIGRIKKLFSPDKGSVLGDFKHLKDVTGIDFASRAQMYKFLAEQLGDEKSLSLLQLVRDVGKGDIATRIYDGAVSYVDGKIRGNPIDVATRIVNKLNNVPKAKKAIQVKAIKEVINKINTVEGPMSKQKAVQMIKKVAEQEVKDNALMKAMELDTSKLHTKLGPTEVIGRGGLYDTPYGQVDSSFFDGRVEKIKVGDKTFGRGEVPIYKRMGEEEIAQAAKVAKYDEMRTALNAIKNGKNNRVSGPQLNYIMEDLGIKSIDDIPDDALEEVLKMARASKNLPPKK